MNPSRSLCGNGNDWDFAREAFFEGVLGRDYS